MGSSLGCTWGLYAIGKFAITFARLDPVYVWGLQQSHFVALGLLTQALLSVGIGFLLGVAFTLALSAIVPYTGLNLFLQMRAAALLKVGTTAIVIGGASAIVPIVQIAGLDPAMVFRGKTK